MSVFGPALGQVSCSLIPLHTAPWPRVDFIYCMGPSRPSVSLNLKSLYLVTKAMAPACSLQPSLNSLPLDLHSWKCGVFFWVGLRSTSLASQWESFLSAPCLPARLRCVLQLMAGIWLSAPELSHSMGWDKVFPSSSLPHFHPHYSIQICPVSFYLRPFPYAFCSGPAHSSFSLLTPVTFCSLQLRSPLPPYRILRLCLNTSLDVCKSLSLALASFPLMCIVSALCTHN